MLQLQNAIVPRFDERIVAIADFLPESTFTNLLEAVKREAQAQRKRVHIPTHKRGAAISYPELRERAPEIVDFYQSAALHEWCSLVIGERVVPTPLNDLSSCSVLIYERQGDRIGWHYDLNFYRGRHFTALLSLVNTGHSSGNVSSATLMIRQGGEDVAVSTPPNTLVLFEGAFVYHGVMALREAERRIVLSMTFCTETDAGRLQTWQRRFKDIAYFGLKALWT